MSINNTNKQIKILEGSRAIALAVAACQPGVVAAFPITPQTHIVEDLASLAGNGQLKTEFVRAESETAAASIILGAAAAGEKAYTATSSQGLLHMLEVVYNFPGINIGVVMTLANRALSAPINIWNDLSDAMAMRDAGWLMLFAESTQEAVDMHIIAFRLASELNLPVCVNVDGFLITHTSEPVLIPEQKLVTKFLGKAKPKKYLDTKKPQTVGHLVGINEYQNFKQEQNQKLINSKKIIENCFKEYYKQINTQNLSSYSASNNSSFEYFGTKNASIVILTIGSIAGTIKETIASNKNIALLRLKTYRPFPSQELLATLKNKKKIIVLDRALAPGAEAPLSAEIKAALYGQKAQIISVVGGLGGKTINKESITKLIKYASNKKNETIFL